MKKIPDLQKHNDSLSCYKEGKGIKAVNKNGWEIQTMGSRQYEQKLLCV